MYDTKSYVINGKEAQTRNREELNKRTFTGFSKGVKNQRRGCTIGWRALQNLMGAGVNTWGSMGLKSVLKNTCEGVYLLVKFLAMSLLACKFLKMNFFTHIFQRF